MRWLLLLLSATVCTTAAWKDRGQAEQESNVVGGWLANDDEVKLQDYFEQWKAAHGRNYSGDAEEKLRYGQFRSNLARIVKINRDSGGSNAQWWAEPNGVADLSWEEFSAGYLGLVEPAGSTLAESGAGGSGDNSNNGNSYGNRKLLAVVPPTTVDWVVKGKVTSVKNQAGCGACWAFAATAALESKILIAKSNEYDLSEQHLVDCVNAELGYGSNGCVGGWPTDAFNYVYRTNQTTETKYPYKAATGTCRQALLAGTVLKNTVKIAKSPGYTTIVGLKVADFQNAVAISPVVVAFNSNSDFQLYGGGIFPASSCLADDVNHVVLVVGYNATAGVAAQGSYWTIKNSWGTDWGEAGYAKVEMMPDDTWGACAMYYYKYRVLI